MQYLLLYKVIKRQLQRIMKEKSLRSGKYKSRGCKSHVTRPANEPTDIIGIPSGVGPLSQLYDQSYVNWVLIRNALETKPAAAGGTKHDTGFGDAPNSFCRIKDTEFFLSPKFETEECQI